MKARFGYLLLAALTVPIGLGVKRAPEEWVGRWLADCAGGTFYTLFWSWVAAFVWVRTMARGFWGATRVAVGVLLLSWGIEFSQLYHTPGWDALRQNRLGRLLLGTTFSVEDLPYYALGSFLFLAIALPLRRTIHGRTLDRTDHEQED